MKQTRRTIQVSEVIRDAIATILRRDVSDPDIGFVTITGVEISTDLRLARIYVSSFGDAKAQKKSIEALQRHRGKIRALLGRRITLRLTPELEFRLDTTPERASSIESILQKVGPPKPAESEEAADDDATDDDERTES